jgi:RNA polymerase sigma factor (sigma-70 family)
VTAVAEQALIQRAQRREPAAMRQLIDLHKDRLFAFVWRMIRNHHDTEEICQEAFLKAFAALERFDPTYRFSTWLFHDCLSRHTEHHAEAAGGIGRRGFERIRRRC